MLAMPTGEAVRCADALIIEQQCLAHASVLTGHVPAVIDQSLTASTSSSFGAVAEHFRLGHLLAST